MMAQNLKLGTKYATLPWVASIRAFTTVTGNRTKAESQISRRSLNLKHWQFTFPKSPMKFDMYTFVNTTYRMWRKRVKIFSSGIFKKRMSIIQNPSSCWTPPSRSTCPGSPSSWLLSRECHKCFFFNLSREWYIISVYLYSCHPHVT